MLHCLVSDCLEKNSEKHSNSNLLHLRFNVFITIPGTPGFGTTGAAFGQSPPVTRSLFGSTPSSGGLFGGSGGSTFGTQSTSGFSKCL